MPRYICRAHILVEATDPNDAVAAINEMFDRALQLQILNKAEWNFTSPLVVWDRVHSRDDLRLIYDRANVKEYGGLVESLQAYVAADDNVIRDRKQFLRLVADRIRDDIGP